MDPKSLTKEEIERRIVELDDKLEVLVGSLNPGAPETHASTYAEMTAIHDEIFALKALLGKGSTKTRLN